MAQTVSSGEVLPYCPFDLHLKGAALRVSTSFLSVSEAQILSQAFQNMMSQCYILKLILNYIDSK